MRRAFVIVTAALLAGCGKTGEAPSTRSAVQTAPQAVYRVPSGSMEPTLALGSYVAVRPLEGAPKVGEIVVLYPPQVAAVLECGPRPHTIRSDGAACDSPVPRPGRLRFVKRVVAGPGDHVSIVAGHVIRNGVREPDPYTRPCGAAPDCDFPVPITIPPGEWFLLGDNRGESDDSRFWGPVPAAWIVGEARPCQRVGIACAASE